MEGLKTVLEQVTGIKTRIVPRICEKHGRYNAVVAVGIDEKPVYSKCPVCQNEDEMAKIRLARAESGQASASGNQTEQDKEALIVARLVKAGLQDEYLHCSFSNFNTFGNQGVLDVVNAFRRVCNSDTLNLTVVGVTGQGKTHLAAATLRNVALNDPGKKISMRYVRESKMLRSMKASFSNKNYNGPSEQQIIDDLSTVDVLIIDEIGKSLESQYNAQALEEIMDARYQKRRTIILGNLSQSDLANHFTDGTKSRLSWKSEKKELNVGEDYRRRLELGN